MENKGSNLRLIVKTSVVFFYIILLSSLSIPKIAADLDGAWYNFGDIAILSAYFQGDLLYYAMENRTNGLSASKYTSRLKKIVKIIYNDNIYNAMVSKYHKSHVASHKTLYLYLLVSCGEEKIWEDEKEYVKSVLLENPNVDIHDENNTTLEAQRYILLAIKENNDKEFNDIINDLIVKYKLLGLWDLYDLAISITK